MEEYVRKTLPVNGMDCASCVRTLEKELKKLGGVRDANVNFLMKKVVITYYPERVGISEIESEIEDLGYRLGYKKYDNIFDKISKALGVGKAEDAFRFLRDQEFDDMVLRSNRPVVVLFGHDNCPSCNALNTRLARTVEKFKNRIVFFQMDTERSKRWEDYNITSAPSIMLFLGGKLVEHWDSPPEVTEVEDKLNEAISILENMRLKTEGTR